MKQIDRRSRLKFLRYPHILLSKFVLWLVGWSVEYTVPIDMRKAVLVVAPHTSNWDFILGRLFYNAIDVPVRFVIKKESFKFPFGSTLKLLGGIPIDRQNPGTIVEDIAARFNQYDELILAITPEGTRRANPNWKKGFYKIAMRANVPMILSYLDYGKKKAFIGKIIFPSGDYCSDIKIIAEFYSECKPKYIENFVLPIIEV